MTGAALVTGASSGIGLASAISLRNAGFTVFAGVRRPASADEARAHRLEPLFLDVTDPASMDAAHNRVEAAGGLEVLVNSAGHGLIGPMEEIALEEIRALFDVNVFGLLRMSQLVLPGMRRRRRGRIIHIGSVGGLFTAPGAGAYHMSKYALEALTDAMRAEVGGFGVQVSLVQPTGVRTAFVGNQVQTPAPLGSDQAYEPFKAALAKMTEDLFASRSSAVVAPEAVAKVVLRAATARKPRPRYPVGLVAHVLPALRRVTPDTAWDRMMLKQIGVTPGRL